MTRIMGEPFPGTGSPPEGYKPGDYVEFFYTGREWLAVNDEPLWAIGAQYRLEATHPHYLPPVWCLDRAAQLAGRGGWGDGDFGSVRLKKSIIAHARTLRDGCEPMREPVDPLLLAMREAFANGMKGEGSVLAHFSRNGRLDVRLKAVLDELRARFDITEKAK